MGFLDDFLGEVVKDVIGIFDHTITIRRDTTASDPFTGVATGGWVSNTFSASPPQSAEYNTEKGTTATGISWTIPGSGIPYTPVPETDYIVHEGKELKIIFVNPVYSGSLVASYTLICAQ